MWSSTRSSRQHPDRDQMTMEPQNNLQRNSILHIFGEKYNNPSFVSRFFLKKNDATPAGQNQIQYPLCQDYSNCDQSDSENLVWSCISSKQIVKE